MSIIYEDYIINNTVNKGTNEIAKYDKFTHLNNTTTEDLLCLKM